jgi:uncharacterized protein (DUF2252 family)
MLLFAAARSGFTSGSKVQIAQHIEGPTAWICGDCQVGNLGPVSSADGADGAVAIQIRDFDQTITPAYDATARSVCLWRENRLPDHPATG